MDELALLLKDEKLNPPAAPAEVKISRRPGRFRLRLFAGILARLLKGGIPLLQSLEILEEESDRTSEKKILFRIKESIREGQSLSETLRKMQQVFPGDFVHAVQAGEASGNLDTVLEESANHLEKKEGNARKIKEASAYPCLILAVGFATLFILLKAVVPRIAEVYSDFGGELPGITRLILSLSRYSLPLFASLVCTAAASALFFYRNRDVWTDTLIRLPLLGRLVLQSFLFKFSATLSLLLRSGVPVFSALQIMSGVDGRFFQRDVERLRDHLAQGQSFANSLKGNRWMTRTALALIRSGEESGRLPESLAQIAAETQKDIESRIDFSLRLLEPVMILIVGLIAGVIVVGTLLPIFEMNGLLQ